MAESLADSSVRLTAVELAAYWAHWMVVEKVELSADLTVVSSAEMMAAGRAGRLAGRLAVLSDGLTVVHWVEHLVRNWVAW